MNHDKLKQFSMISALITTALSGLFKAQDLLVDMMIEQCDMHKDMKESILEDMNKVIGVRKA